MRYAYAPDSADGERRYAERMAADTAQRPPAPLVTSRDPIPPGVCVPGSVGKLGARAEGFGWTAVVTYSLGFGLLKYRGAWQQEELWAVRVARYPLAGYAMYRRIAHRGTWAWRSCWVAGADLKPRKLSYAVFAAFLGHSPGMDAEAVLEELGGGAG